MQCRYCGKRLPLLKKLANDEFCTRGHQQKYLEEQNLLALARLEEARQRFIRQDARKTAPATDSTLHAGGPQSPEMDVGAFVDDRPLLVRERLICTPRLAPHTALTKPAIPSPEFRARARHVPKGSRLPLADEQLEGASAPESAVRRAEIAPSPLDQASASFLYPSSGVRPDKSLERETEPAPCGDLIGAGEGYVEAVHVAARPISAPQPVVRNFIRFSRSISGGPLGSCVLAAPGGLRLTLDACQAASRQIHKPSTDHLPSTSPATAAGVRCDFRISTEAIGLGSVPLPQERTEAEPQLTPLAAPLEPCGPVPNLDTPFGRPLAGGRPAQPLGAANVRGPFPVATPPAGIVSSTPIPASLAGLARSIGFSQTVAPHPPTNGLPELSIEPLAVESLGCQAPRCTHELAYHGFELAAGSPHPVEPLAAGLSHGVLETEQKAGLTPVHRASFGLFDSGVGLLGANVDIAGRLSSASCGDPGGSRIQLPLDPLKIETGHLIPSLLLADNLPLQPFPAGCVDAGVYLARPATTARPSPKASEKILIRLSISPVRHSATPDSAHLVTPPPAPSLYADEYPEAVSQAFRPVDTSNPSETPGEAPRPPATTLAVINDSATGRRLLPLPSFQALDPGSKTGMAVIAHQEECSGSPLLLPRVALEPDSFANAASRRARGLLDGKSYIARMIDPATRFWRVAPADLRWIALALPIVLAVTLMPTLTRSSRPASPASPQKAAGSVVSKFLATNFSSVHQSITARAAVNWNDDFRSGLSSWDGEENWARSWSYDEAGFVRPGKLAIARPSIRMKDYTLEFLGQIETKALSWVFRAADLKNYYVMKLVITKPGPLPTVSLVRRAVIGGKADKAQELPLPIPGLRSDTIYHVRVEVDGDSFSTYLQGQLVDTFSDERLKSGGVGFFTDAGERARLRWVGVTYQYDFLGRLCALLAPYSVESETERWK